MGIKRSEVVQQLLDLFESPRYLEIGVQAGKTFHAVRAARKVAVDPTFRFEDAQRQAGAQYHEMTSDSYFHDVVKPDERFDVIFVDGLHTAEQTLRDFLNSLQFLSEKGVILIDDVRPSSYQASIPDRGTFVKVRAYLKDESKAWMGDVFRLVYFIETFCQQFSYRTISDNHGQTVVWRARRADLPERTIEEVGRKSFADLVVERDSVLRPAPFAEIIEVLKGRGG